MTSLSTPRALLNLEVANLGRVGRFLLLEALILGAFVAGGMVSTLPVVTGITAISVATNTWTTDEVQRLPLLYGSLPIRRRDVVASHYRWVGLLVVLATVVTAALAALTVALHPTLGSPVDAAWAATLVMGSIALAPAIMMPMRLKFGQTAGLIMLAATIGLGTMAGMLVGDAVTTSRGVGAPLPVMGSPLAALAGILVLNVVAWAVSYVICRGLYEHKDF